MHSSTCPQKVGVAPALSWAPAVVSLDTSKPASLVPPDPERRTVTISVDADGTSPVYVLDNPNRNYADGVKLKPGAGISIATTAEVWVVCPAGDGTTVYAFTENGYA